MTSAKVRSILRKYQMPLAHSAIDTKAEMLKLEKLPSEVANPNFTGRGNQPNQMLKFGKLKH
jgi:hypothetical protein